MSASAASAPAAPAVSAPDVPPGGAVTLARLAYNRLGFGARPGDADFNDAAVTDRHGRVVEDRPLAVHGNYCRIVK